MHGELPPPRPVQSSIEGNGPAKDPPGHNVEFFEDATDRGAEHERLHHKDEKRAEFDDTGVADQQGPRWVDKEPHGQNEDDEMVEPLGRISVYVQVRVQQNPHGIRDDMEGDQHKDARTEILGRDVDQAPEAQHEEIHRDQTAECVVKLRPNFWGKLPQPPHCTNTDQSVLYRLLLVVGDTGKLLRAACVAF